MGPYKLLRIQGVSQRMSHFILFFSLYWFLNLTELNSHTLTYNIEFELYFYYAKLVITQYFMEQTHETLLITLFWLHTYIYIFIVQ